MTVLDEFADPRTRLALGIAGMAATAVAVRRDRVGRRETRVFRAVNGLPDALFGPAWVVMQLGTLAAAPAAAGVALALRERTLARRLLVGGTASWALSKVVKQGIRRPRPAALLPDAQRRGQDAAGLGYLSGHAAVAVALGTAVLPRLAGPRRTVVLGLVPVVGLCRIYVGAHLPLDVLGGAAMGLAIEAAVGLWTGEPREGRRPRERRLVSSTGSRAAKALAGGLPGGMTTEAG